MCDIFKNLNKFYQFQHITVSTVTKGEQMVAVLNELNTHCAVFGNHDFDFGLEILSQYVQQTTCPWLMSNVLDNETGRPLGDGKISHAINWQGQKIGFVRLLLFIFFIYFYCFHFVDIK